jgi:hypothetical protein
MTEKSPTREAPPVPDPTILTTEAQLRDVAALRAMIAREITMLRELIEARLDGMDKAITLQQVATDKFPDAIDSAVEQLQELHDEKFRSIAVQFAERDIRTEQTSRDSKVAVDAALQAAKEAVGEQNKSSALAISKSETGTAKQIDQQGMLIQTETRATNEKIDDLKERLTALEGRSQGSSNTWVVIVGVAGLLVAIAAVVVTIVVATRPH